MRRTSAAILFLLSLSVVVFAQGGSGSIAGQVTNPNGEVIPGAKITATNVETNIKAEAVSGDSGTYQLPQLSPGRYTVEVESAGFKKFLRTITVQVSDRLTIDFPLELGDVSETVSITAEAPLLRREDAQLGEVIDQTMIQNLPQLNRDPLQLLRLAGNVQGDGGRATEGSDTRINGGRTQGIEYFSDGIAQSTGRAHGVTDLTPTAEAVQEFKVITNGISAEYGRLSGGAVELITRSGTNDFHGQVFEYLQHDSLNANSWNQNRLGGERTPFKNHNFGFAAGGPIVLPRFGEGGPSVWTGRNRSFFFFNYDGRRFNQSGILREASVPTAEERAGDFTNTQVNGTRTLLFDPFGRTRVLPDGTIERLDLLGGDGRHVPANRISPVSAAVLSYVPLPNKTPAPGNSFRNNFVGSQDSESSADLWALRLDHNFTESSKIFGRYTRLNNFGTETRWFSPLQTVPTRRVSGAFAANINYDWTVSPTLVFNARLGGHYNPFTGGSSIAEDFNPASIPFDDDTRRILGSKGLPWIGTTAFTDFSGSPSTSVTNSTTYNAGASLVKILNRHTVKFGYEHRRYYDNYLTSGGGEFLFQHNPVQRYSTDNSWNDQDNANVLGAFLLGINDKARIAGERTRSMNVNYHGAFVQDDWKVTPKLTLNLGVRWDMETPPSERYDKLYVWDPDAPSPYTVKPGYNFSAALAAAGLNSSQVRTPAWVTSGAFPSGAVRVANTPEYTSRLGSKWHPWQFAPRFGIAYALDERTVLRGSFAKMYLSTTGDPNGYSTGGGTIALSDAADAGWHRGLSSNFTDAISTFEQPFQRSDVTIYTRDNEVANFQGTGGDPAAAAFDINSRMPREYTWSAGIQRELPKKFLVEATYSANIGRGLLAKDLISRFPRDLFSPDQRTTYVTQIANPFAEETRYGDDIALGRLLFQYPAYGPLQILGANIGRSNYQSLNLRAERRLSGGFEFLVNYTLSKLLDNVGGPNGQNDFIAGGGTGSKSNQSVDTVRDIYGISPLDERHRLIAYYNIELPFGRGRRFLGDPQGFGNKLLDFAVGGWEFAGISQWRSGRPIIIPHTNVNNDPLRIESTFWRWADPNNRNLISPNFSGQSSAFLSGDDYSRLVASGGTPERRFATGLLLEPTFDYGDVNIIEDIRQPSRFTHDLSLMKRFPVFGDDGGRYLQLRMEAQNVFNLRGFGNYNTDPRSATFGLITGPAASVDFGQGLRFDERRIQVSARFVF